MNSSVCCEISINQWCSTNAKYNASLADIVLCPIDLGRFFYLDNPLSKVWNTPPMCQSLDNVRSLDDLRTFIHYTLCEKENLLAEQFTMSECPLTRRGRDCGLQFSLFGPRSIRLGAIWASDHNTIYFYDTAGVRYSKKRLPHRLTALEHERQIA